MKSLSLELSADQQAQLAPLLAEARAGRMTPATPLASIRWKSWPETREIVLDVLLVNEKTAEGIRKVIIKAREKACARSQDPEKAPEAPPRPASAQEPADFTAPQPTP